MRCDAVMIIRPMRFDDIPAVYAIEQSSSPSPWSEKLFHDSLIGGDLAWVTCERDDAQVVGFAIVAVSVGQCHIYNIAIAPTHRRRGLAEALLTHALVESLPFDTEEALLEVRESNTSARALYEKMGFVQVGRRKQYYASAGGEREDALLYTLVGIHRYTTISL